VSGTVSLPNQGTYVRTYTITDSTGQTSFVTRTINATDTTIPNVSFGTNGSSTYAKSRSTSVTVTDPTAPTATYSGVNASSLKYLWSTSTSTPSEGSFSTTFTNGGTLSVSGVTGDYYLWILAKDNAGNTRIIRTNVFKLDNTPPPAPSIARSPGSWTTGNVTLTPSCGADGHSGVSSCCYWNGSSCISASYIGQATGTKTFASVDAAGNISTNTASVSSRTEYQYTDKYFNFNGSSYMRSTTAGIYGILVNDGASQFIFEAGIYLYSKSSNFYFFDAGESGGTPRFALWYRASDSTVRVYAKNSSTVYIDTGYSYNFALNTYYTIRVAGGTDSSRGYTVSINGGTLGTTGSSYRFATNDQYTHIGRRYTAADYMNGRMYYFFFQGRKSGVASVAYNYCPYNYYGAAYVNPYNPSNFTEIGDANYRFNFTGITVGGSPSGWSTTDPGSNCYRYRETRTTYY
jgi:hypothetical protein